MAICYKLGAVLAGWDTDKIISLENYGYNLGITYQLLNDSIGNVIDAVPNIALIDAMLKPC